MKDTKLLPGVQFSHTGCIERKMLPKEIPDQIGFSDSPSPVYSEKFGAFAVETILKDLFFLFSSNHCCTGTWSPALPPFHLA